MQKKVDLVTVAFTGELKMLKLQARSIRLYADPDLVGTIHVIIHDNFPAAFLYYFNRRIRKEYGHFAEKVQVTHYRDLTVSRIPSPGWKSQQAVKLLAARLVETETFLILDSKNHFTRPLTHDLLFTPDARAKMPLEHFNTIFSDERAWSCEYFKAPPPPTLPCLPTITPFLMVTKIARALVAEVEAREDVSFSRFFKRKARANEFYFYMSFIQARHDNLELFYEHTKPIVATYFITAVENPDVTEKVKQHNDLPSIYAMGVHRKVTQSSHTALKEHITHKWLEFNLVENESEAAYFLTPDTPVADTRQNRIKDRLLNLIA